MIVRALLAAALLSGVALAACQPKPPDPQARRPDPETHPAVNPAASPATSQPSTASPDVETAVEEAEQSRERPRP